MGHDGQIGAAYNAKTKTYEYHDGFKFVKPIIKKYDLAIANLEVTLAGKPYKGYPQFSSPDALAPTLVDAGFNVILTANNHSCDRGKNGVIRTLDQLDKLGVAHTGTFRNQEERDKTYPLIVEKNGLKVALLNYTYGTNGLTVPKPLIINYIDSVIIKKDIARAKELKADYIICNMHWGTEYKLLPNKYQKTYEQVCYRAGADMVIGGHPHVLQPVEKKKINGKEKLTVWSLGNFVSNMQVRYTRGGVMVGAHVKQSEGKAKLDRVENHLVYVLKKQEGATKPYYILPDFNYNYYRPGFISAAELVKMKQFFDDSRKLFDEHNKGDVLEARIVEDTHIGAHFEKLLKGYYAVKVLEKGKEHMNSDLLGHYFHKSVDHAGNVNYLSGYYNDPNMAKGHLKFLTDCGVKGRLVLVKPQKLTAVE